MTSDHQAYNPQQIEKRYYGYWEERGFFRSRPEKKQKPYTIVIPPPNVTGVLHLGHALNNSIQDACIRFHRMLGENTCWLPGTDHAGIATQSVVEKNLWQEEKKTRHDLGRQALIERIWAWKEQFGNRIIEQLKRLGCSCDWERLSFTMDPQLSLAVRHVFLELFRDGLIYRGKRLINWCPGCRTALSNDELDYKEIRAFFWQIRYPVIGQAGRFITVATTRPETMLGDVAVAVHPDDLRYRDLVGQTCLLPLMNRELPIIADALLADPQKGTGAVKVTPAHDFADHACGQRHHLPMINILHEDGTLNENAGRYAGLTVQKARDQVLEDLARENLLGEKTTLEHAVAHCYRSDDVIEPYLSDQWFVRMAPLVALAKRASQEKEITFFPGRREEDYLRWLEQTPDWCISRQIWWGHRLPVWYCLSCSPQIERGAKGEAKRIPSDAKPILPPSAQLESRPDRCPTCGGQELVQDPDVVDTWFSSQLWPLSPWGWPTETTDLCYYYPTNLLVTARDIIALWVARMVMMGMKFRQQRPFSHVLVHGTIQDERGDIMSKSRGNGFDPLKAIEGGSDWIHGKEPLGSIPAERQEHYPAYGCDALRHGLLSTVTSQGHDIRLQIQRSKRPDGSYEVSIPSFEEGKRFCNKIWQAAHGVIFAQCKEYNPRLRKFSHLEDRWLSHRLHQTITLVSACFHEYRLGEAAESLYHLFWDDFCSWYLEVAKPRLWGECGERSAIEARTVLLRAFAALLRLMHPIMPFITEALWQEIKPILQTGGGKVAEACIIAAWPDSDEFAEDAVAFAAVERARQIASAINNIRAEQRGLKEDKRIPQVILASQDAQALSQLENLFTGIKKLARVDEIITTQELAQPDQSASRLVEEVRIFVPLAGLLDLEAEKKKLEQEAIKVTHEIARLEQKLANAEYTSRAPAAVVDRDRQRLAEHRERLTTLNKQRL